MFRIPCAGDRNDEGFWAFKTALSIIEVETASRRTNFEKVFAAVIVSSFITATRFINFEAF
jgi:hypothetical protein